MPGVADGQTSRWREQHLDVMSGRVIKQVTLGVCVNTRRDVVAITVPIQRWHKWKTRSPVNDVYPAVAAESPLLL